MAEQEILDVRGKAIEIVLWRGTDNLFEAALADADGNPVNLTDADVIFTIVDRAGGTVQFSETKTPDQHTDAANGITRFSLPASATEDLTGNRAYTWKHQVVKRDRTTHVTNIFFYGDVRVMSPSSAVTPPPEV